MRRAAFTAAILIPILCIAGLSSASVPASGPFARIAHNVIIFVADGLRHDSVNSTDSPTLAAARARGVHFTNSHSLFPTLTMANASAIATGHYLGDTGVFSNTEYVGFAIFDSGSFGHQPGTPTPFTENDQVLADLDDHFPARNFGTETSLLALAHEHGFNTAAIGKLGPVALQDLTRVGSDRDGFLMPQTLVIDDSTGTPEGVPLPRQTAAALSAAGLSLVAPSRRQSPGNFTTAGTLEANAAQQSWLVDAATKAILPAFVRSGKPFVLVYWSRDPDGTQHNQGDSLNSLSPGINGPTARAAIANADANLKQILDYLDATPEARATTDVFITSDHGFATISKHEIDARGRATRSYSTTFTYRNADGQTEVAPGWLPPGFLAIDLAHALSLPLFDSDAPVQVGDATRYVPVDPSKPSSAASRQRPTIGSALIGGSGIQSRARVKTAASSDAKVIVAVNGGSDLIYILDPDVRLARRVVTFLGAQDYTGALFVSSKLGKFAGTLPMTSIGLEGAATTPQPSIVVAFKTFLREPGNLLSAVQIADTTLQEGQGSHGSFGRDNTFNNMAAFGPDFKHGFVDELPVSNADLAVSAAYVLGLTLPAKGHLQGRVVSEAFSGGQPGSVPGKRTIVSSVNAAGKATVLQFQQAEGIPYFDAACFIDAGELVRRPSGARACADAGN